MTDNLRREVLRVFKNLHRTRLNTFKGDERALEAARNKINEEYRKYKHVTNEAAIQELNKLAIEIETEIRTTVVQAVQHQPDKPFELRITEDTIKVDNISSMDSCQNLKPRKSRLAKSKSEVKKCTE